jgi:hypothetical protein
MICGEISTLYKTGGTWSPGKDRRFVFKRGGSQPLCRLGWSTLWSTKVVKKKLYGSGSWISSLQRQADQAASTETSIESVALLAHALPVDSSRLFDSEGRPLVQAVG